MTDPAIHKRTTRVTRHIKARRFEIYGALVDPSMVALWLAPGTMRCVVHEFEPREGGRFRMSLTYQDVAGRPAGKTAPDTDTFSGHLVGIVPNERVVQVVEFESQQPGIAGQMRITWELVDAGAGTDVTAICEDIPPGIRLEDNEEGTALSLQKLARLLEKPERSG
jgi:uncharacterized protein YndB with AHSA1/START domain